jgi:DNA-binding NtrC family response regulator
LFAKNHYALIISDMGRKEGKKEGYVLLEKVREINTDIPFIILGNCETAVSQS